MAKRNANHLHKTVPFVVVGISAVLALGVFLHYYTGSDQSSVLGAQTGTSYSEQKSGWFAWFLKLFSWGGVKVDAPAKSTTPMPYGSDAGTGTRGSMGYDVSTSPDAADAQILQDINSTEDDGGAMDFKELEQSK